MTTAVKRTAAVSAIACTITSPAGLAAGRGWRGAAAPQLQVPADHEADEGNHKRQVAGGIGPQKRDDRPIRVGQPTAEARDQGRPDPDQHGGIAGTEGHRLDS